MIVIFYQGENRYEKIAREIETANIRTKLLRTPKKAQIDPKDAVPSSFEEEICSKKYNNRLTEIYNWFENKFPKTIGDITSPVNFSVRKNALLRDFLVGIISKDLNLEQQLKFQTLFGTTKDISFYYGLNEDERIDYIANNFPSSINSNLCDNLNKLENWYTGLYEKGDSIDVYIESFIYVRDKSFVKSFLVQHHHLPLLYILEEFFSNREDDFVKFYGMYYGIGCILPYTPQTIAEKMHCSRENIRLRFSNNTINSYIPKLIVNNKGWRYYDFLDTPVIVEGDASYCFFKDIENLNTPFIGFLGILQSLNLYKIVKIRGQKCGVDVELLETVDFSSVMQWLDSSHEVHSRLGGKLDIDTYLMSYDLAQETYFKLRESISIIANVIYGYEYNNSEDLVFPGPIVLEVTAIIKKVGRPLCYNEILQSYREKYTTHSFPNPKQLRRLLCGIYERFSIIGTTGYYYIASLWHYDHFKIINDVISILKKNDHFCPCAVEQLAENITTMDAPLSPELIERIILEDKSLRIIYIQDEGFERLDMFILEALHSHYSLWIPRSSINGKQYNFEKQLKEYIGFIINNGRLPKTYSADEKEVSLSKWRYHYLNYIGVKIYDYDEDYSAYESREYNLIRLVDRILL